MLNDHPLNVPNLCTPQPDLLACGMPSEQDLQDAARKGIKTVINLCPQEETPASESDQVAALGMHYVNIPIRGAQDLTRDAARQLAALMEDCNHHPLLVHCRSANRVGALVALKEYWCSGKSAEEALAMGRKAGLSKLEPGVVELMRRDPA
ncbi:MAG: sulfur transferase domain-containing protein [Pseudomonadota bacterium]|nr:sulfur transferase domain-containing protein [Pseudomonadota bacterium]